MREQVQDRSIWTANCLFSCFYYYGNISQCQAHGPTGLNSCARLSLSDVGCLNWTESYDCRTSETHREARSWTCNPRCCLPIAPRSGHTRESIYGRVAHQSGSQFGGLVMLADLQSRAPSSWLNRSRYHLAEGCLQRSSSRRGILSS